MRLDFEPGSRRQGCSPATQLRSRNQRQRNDATKAWSEDFRRCVDFEAIDEQQKVGAAMTNGEQYRKWWQQQKAEKAARKVEKWAEKARRSGYVY
ncbi:hypothetical protein CLAFUW4_12228 [Fulvia fulva]|uniref:Uncharacterized protein n=1 Tax=Passalora fulva TaxID=5499 RepID=A0A9Q8PF62_PASFU|nr:uncharacterized protein CLAFUR5_11258 [Fulvia fulva]KAK4617446.1 hypothetical protein CLAFUR4_12233 [Fulvia fulva]KAK4618723.1 hypothetical protein CLAFUR0_12244 [Fulvia fulva]UJO21304.1 hypothetical protein CLAFUR5_11258 [Fulvia fulva]WPV18116.1 hypothetical protein CLAFUW4_12228 [Fulvia fulva]WPV32964.1 hypothetical protein CLAFUW7_12235 [Fulvia fulva]